MLKETDLYVQSLVVLSLIKSNELSLGFLNALSGIGEYADPFKKLKIKKYWMKPSKNILMQMLGNYLQKKIVPLSEQSQIL